MCNKPLMPHVFKEGRREASYFFKLIGKVRHAAVMKLTGNLGKRKFIVD